MTTQCLSTLPQVEIERRLQADLPCWRYEEGCLRRVFRTNGWQETLRVVNAVGQLAEEGWQGPLLTVSSGSVEIRLRATDADGVTSSEISLARLVDDILRSPAPGLCQRGVGDIPAVRSTLPDVIYG